MIKINKWHLNFKKFFSFTIDRNNNIFNSDIKIDKFKNKEIITKYINDYKLNKTLPFFHVKNFLSEVNHYEIDYINKNELIELVKMIVGLSHKPTGPKVLQPIELQVQNSKIYEKEREQCEFLNNFRSVLNKNINLLNLKDIQEIFKSLNSKKDELFIQQLNEILNIVLNRKNLDYFMTNMKELSFLSSNLKFQTTIGNNINKFLKEKADLNSIFSDSDKSFIDFCSTLKLDEEITKKIMPLVLTNTNPNININKIELDNSSLNKSFEMIDQLFKSEKLKTWDEKLIKNSDNEMTIFLQNLYKNNELDSIYKTMKIINIQNHFESNYIKLFPNFISALNDISNDYLTKFQKPDFGKNSFLEFFEILVFYIKFYNELKAFLFVKNEKFEKIFYESHNIIFSFFEIINKIEIKDNLNSFNTVKNIMYIYKTCYFNNIKSNDLEEFYTKKFLKKGFELPFKNQLLPYYIFSNLNFENQSKLDNLLGYFINFYTLNLDSNELTDEKIRKEKHFSFKDYTTILYELLINNYQNEQILAILIENLIKNLQASNFSLHEKSYHKLYHIIKNIQLFISKGQLNDVKKNNLSDLEDLSYMIQIFTKSSPQGFPWWSNESSFYNKYSYLEIKDIFIKNSKVKFIEQRNLLPKCDFEFELTTKEKKFVDFLSPFHFINLKELKDVKNVNPHNYTKKFQRKIELYLEFEKTNLVLINYYDILKSKTNIKI